MPHMLKPSVLRVLLVVELATDLEKSFQEAHLSMVLISDGNLFVEHMQDAHVARLLIHEG